MPLTAAAYRLPSRDEVDIDAKDFFGAQDGVQQSVDHPTMAEHRDGVLVVARCDDVANARVDASEKRVLVNAAR